MNRSIRTIKISKPFFCGSEMDKIRKTLDSGWIMQGPRVEEFERELADYVGAPYAVAVSSGTTALHLALLISGIKNNDEILVPSYSFIASANCILYLGAKPVFVDVELNTSNLDADRIKCHISKKTKAILVVHQFGLPADMDRINKIADKYGLKVIEDAACALGSSYKNKMIGNISHISCFSFHPRKVITTGEGGMITTSCKKIAQKIKILRSHGFENNRAIMLGYNYRMTDIQAAIGIKQIENLNKILHNRHKLAQRYNKAFKERPYINIPFVPDYVTSFNYQSYAIRVKSGLSRSIPQIIRLLEKRSISAKQGIAPIHLEPYYQNRFGKIRLKNTEELFNSTIILPLYSSMSYAEQNYVIENICCLLK